MNAQLGTLLSGLALLVSLAFLGSPVVSVLALVAIGFAWSVFNIICDETFVQRKLPSYIVVVSWYAMLVTSVASISIHLFNTLS